MAGRASAAFQLSLHCVSAEPALCFSRYSAIWSFWVGVPLQLLLPKPTYASQCPC